MEVSFKTSLLMILTGICLTVLYVLYGTLENALFRLIINMYDEFIVAGLILLAIESYVDLKFDSIEEQYLKLDSIEKQYLITQLRSQDATLTSLAINLLRQKGQFDKDILIGADLKRTNLSKTDLSKINLTRADLSQGNLNESDLSGAMLAEIVARNASFDSAILLEVDLRASDLTGASFKKANLRYVDFSNSLMVDVDFSGADLTNAILPKLIDPKFDKSTIWPDGGNSSPLSH